MNRGALSHTAIGVGLACLAALACSGKLDSSSGQRTPDIGAGAADVPGPVASTTDPPHADDPPRPGDPPRVSVPPPAPVDAGQGGNCTSLGARCQVFEPGGSEGRWGCHTLGTRPELACEHAPGATIARCNCSGAFGSGSPVAWFDIPATSTPFSESDVVQLWKDRCAGECVPR